MSELRPIGKLGQEDTSIFEIADKLDVRKFVRVVRSETKKITARERKRVKGSMAGRVAKSRWSRYYFLRSFDNRGTVRITRNCARVHMLSHSLSISKTLFKACV